MKSKETEEEIRSGMIKGVLFIPYTVKSELAKRVRNKLKMYEKISNLKVRVVEKTGQRIMDVLHKSNPWESNKCGREDCMICKGPEEKMWKNVDIET